MSGLTWVRGLEIRRGGWPVCMSLWPRRGWGSTYSVGDLELLASADVARLGDGGLEAAEGLVVQSLFPTVRVSMACLSPPSITSR